MIEERQGLSVLRTFIPCTLLETLTLLMSRLVVEELVFDEDLNI